MGGETNELKRQFGDDVYDLSLDDDCFDGSAFSNISTLRRENKVGALHSLMCEVVAEAERTENSLYITTYSSDLMRVFCLIAVNLNGNSILIHIH